MKPKLNELGERVKYLYVVTLRGTDKRYYGIAFDCKERWNREKGDARHNRSDTHFIRGLRKYGPDAFDWEVICAFPNEVLAKAAEKSITRIPGLCHYNSVDGGGGGNPSPETRAKMCASQQARGPTRQPHTDETKALISAAHKGKVKGPLPEEQRKKIGEASLGRVVKEETKIKISKTKKELGQKPTPEASAKGRKVLEGRPTSPETIEKIKKALTGKPKPPGHGANVSAAQKGIIRSDDFKEKCRQRQLGVRPSEETRKRQSEARKGKSRPAISRKLIEVWAVRRQIKYMDKLLAIFGPKAIPMPLP